MKQDMDIEQLYEAGYRRGFPHWGMIETSDIDISVCGESKCENCGHIGMDCQPWVKEETNSYRAFAVCPECHSSFEF